MRLVKGLIAGALCAVTALTVTGCGMDRDEFNRERQEQINAMNDLMGTPYKNPMLSDYVLAPAPNGNYTLHFEDCGEVDTDGDGFLNANCYRMSVHAKHTYLYDAKRQQAYLNRNKDGQTTITSSVGHGLSVYQDRLDDAVIVTNNRKIGDRMVGVITECGRMRGVSPHLSEMSGYVIEHFDDYRLVHMHEFINKCIYVKVDANGELAEGFERMPNQFSTDWRMARYKLRQMESLPADWWHSTDWERVGDFIIRREAKAAKGSIRYKYKPLKKCECRFE